MISGVVGMVLDAALKVSQFGKGLWTVSVPEVSSNAG